MRHNPLPAFKERALSEGSKPTVIIILIVITVMVMLMTAVDAHRCPSAPDPLLLSLIHI